MTAITAPNTITFAAVANTLLPPWRDLSVRLRGGLTRSIIDAALTRLATEAKMEPARAKDILYGADCTLEEIGALAFAAGVRPRLLEGNQ